MAQVYTDYDEKGLLGLKTITLGAAEYTFPPNDTAGHPQILPPDLAYICFQASGGSVSLKLTSGSANLFNIVDGMERKLSANDLSGEQVYFLGAAGVTVNITMQFIRHTRLA